VIINTLEWYDEGGIRFRSPDPPLPRSHSCALTASSPPAEMDRNKHPQEESSEVKGP
jgi:hypothetical protein